MEGTVDRVTVRGAAFRLRWHGAHGGRQPRIRGGATMAAAISFSTSASVMRFGGTVRFPVVGVTNLRCDLASAFLSPS